MRGRSNYLRGLGQAEAFNRLLSTLDALLLGAAYDVTGGRDLFLMLVVPWHSFGLLDFLDGFHFAAELLCEKLLVIPVVQTQPNLLALPLSQPHHVQILHAGFWRFSENCGHNRTIYAGFWRVTFAVRKPGTT